MLVSDVAGAVAVTVRHGVVHCQDAQIEDAAPRCVVVCCITPGLTPVVGELPTSLM